VPGPLGLPDPFADITRAGINLAGINPSASRSLEAGFRGDLDPNDISALQDESARFGVQSGMPGSGLGINRYLGNVLGARQARRQQAFQNYGPFVGTVAGTQTVQPGLKHEIALQNALNAAAPNPAQAASYAQQLFNQYLQMLASQGGRGRGGPGGGIAPTGGPSGGTGGGGFPNPIPSPVDPNQPPGWGVLSGEGGQLEVAGNPPTAALPAWAQQGYVTGGPPEDWEEGLF